MSLPEPITRKEQYYDGIARGNASKLPEPITREEQYLEYIAKNGGGGGGGTTDYEALDNKPSVNGVELSGNKTLDDLGIQGKLTFDNEPTEGSQNPVKSGGVYEALESLNEAISRKPDNYEDLPDKPQINSVELDGNKTASDLGLQTELKGAQTVSGNPITITDAEPMNAENVKVELEPKQDLHGYDAPWVGGSGKNLLPMTVDGIKALNTTGTWSGNTYSINNGTVEILTDGNSNVVGLKVNGTFDKNTYLQLSDENAGGFDFLSLNTPYIINGGVSDIGVRAYHYDGSNNASSYGSDAPFTLTSYPVGGNIDVAISLNVTFDDVIIRPMIRLSTETDPTFTPYSNICPITGYSEVNVERVGKNLAGNWEENTVINYLTGEAFSEPNYKTTGWIPVKHAQRITISGTDGGQERWFYNSDKTPNSPLLFGDETYTAPVDGYLRVSVRDINTTIQIEYGETATTYEPYQGSTATISLGGTKYGGTLDVTEGGYSDEWGYIEGDSVSDLVSAGATTGTTDAGLFYIAIAGVGVAVDNDSVATSDQLVCDNLENVSAIANWTTNVSGVCLNTDNNLTFAVKDITTQADMDTWLSNNPIQIAYRKKTPSSVSTTPTDIPLLENTNNISTDGTNITLKYQPNNVIGECKAYTDEQCAKVLPPLPTTDGTYHLSCEVTSGVGVLSWVSDN